MFKSYFETKKIIDKRIQLVACSIVKYLVCGLELIVPILLINPRTTLLGIGLAIQMHIIFALTANEHFSIVMIGALLSFISNSSNNIFLYHLFDPALNIISLLLAITISYFFGFWHLAIKFRKAFLVYIIAICWGLILMLLILLRHHNDFFLLRIKENFTDYLFSFLFFLNASCPYIGIKIGYSFAMFSNLRLDQWSHVIIKRPFISFDQKNYIIVEKVKISKRLSGLYDTGHYLSIHLKRLTYNNLYTYSEHYLYHIILEILTAFPNELEIEINHNNFKYHVSNVKGLNSIRWSKKEDSH